MHSFFISLWIFSHQLAIETVTAVIWLITLPPLPIFFDVAPHFLAREAFISKKPRTEMVPTSNIPVTQTLFNYNTYRLERKSRARIQIKGINRFILQRKCY